jgi:asparagine synthase (glutamine-hydrolysing)
MCGIVGYVDMDRPIAREILATMRDRLAHRGPDDAGLWLSADGCAGLGHRRLSIIDLSALGHQPMLSPDGRHVIVFNGEIYNFRELRERLAADGQRFRSGSDTEVLLAAYRKWGSGCLQHLRGMFAFAIYDTAERRLFAARDRAGEKPFFYRHEGRRLIFASELKALLAHPGSPRRMSPEGLNHYLAFGYVPRDACILEGYRKLPAAHFLTFDQDTAKLELAPYWVLPAPVKSSPEPIEAQAERLEGLLQDSVREQLVADVPIGILLSGGLDSSLVAAMARRGSNSRISTYTISFPGHPDHDESAHARLVADYLNTEHHQLAADENTVDILPKLVAQYDEPIADSSMVPTFIVSELTRRHCTVALGGDGGDELFGGYLHYSWVESLHRLRGLNLRCLGIERTLARMIPVGTPYRNLIFTLFGRFTPEITLNRLIDPDSRRALIDSALRVGSEGPEESRADLIRDRNGALDRLTALDFKTYMCDDILVKVDRASMLTSLEMRAPFLDHRIVEFAFGQVPSEHKVHRGERKRLLRILAKRLLPKEFNSDRKQGFSIPIGSWLKGQWKPLIDDLLQGGSPLFDNASLARALSRWRASDRAGHRIFQLAVLEAWRRHYAIEL